MIDSNLARYINTFEVLSNSGRPIKLYPGHLEAMIKYLKLALEKSKEQTLQEVVQELAAEYGNNISALATSAGVHRSYLNRIYLGSKTEPSKKTLDALGIERIVTYKRK